jgi:hypothetical protein
VQSVAATKAYAADPAYAVGRDLIIEKHSDFAI